MSIMMPPSKDDPKAYAEWFIETFSNEQARIGYIKKYSASYYSAVMRIYKEQIEKNDFTLGPQTPEAWIKLQRLYNWK